LTKQGHELKNKNFEKASKLKQEIEEKIS